MPLIQVEYVALSEITCTTVNAYLFDSVIDEYSCGLKNVFYTFGYTRPLNMWKEFKKHEKIKNAEKKSRLLLNVKEYLSVMYRDTDKNVALLGSGLRTVWHRPKHLAPQT
jgi:hypothetical protein